MYERDHLYVGGEWVAPVDGGRVDVVNPATEAVIGHAPLASTADVDRAVAAARDAYDHGPWPRTAPETRADALVAMAEYLRERARPLAELNIDEAGVPITFAHARELGPVAVFGYFEQLTRAFPWREVRQGALAPALVVREPVGVIGAVVPFNGPIMSAAAKLAPALASGCPIVFKPALETPLDAFVLAEAAEAAGIPPGVVNIVPGGADVGAALVAHAGVDRVVFTGSTTAGRAISEACAGTFKRLTLELGGKAAAVLLDDAPVEQSVASILPMSFFNSGQACIALSRILAPRARYDEVVDAAVEATRAMTVGDPRDAATVLGPVISDRHRARIEAMIDRTRTEGGVVATGGGRPTGLDTGWYVEPTVFRDVDNTGYLAQHEVFGPVVAVMPFEDEAEAVRLANDTEYGLSGSIFTRDVGKALRVARGVETGNLSVNSHAAVRYWTPFGGFKQSGLGRELGPDAPNAFTEEKNVFIASD